MGRQVLRPTYATHVYCSKCGFRKGWYLRPGVEWPNGWQGEVVLIKDGRYICPKHGTPCRDRPRSGPQKREWLRKNGPSWEEGERRWDVK